MRWYVCIDYPVEDDFDQLLKHRIVHITKRITSIEVSHYLK